MWLVVALVLAAAGRLADGVRIAAGAALGGIFAEALKPVVGQVRPHLVEGAHRYWRVEGVEGLSYGMASSHAAVAFGAAWGIVFLYGRAGWIVLGLAAACALERMMAGAHFATDVYVGAVLGYAGARLVRAGGWAGVREGLLVP
jgi:membrane-associated phospholipid phosphatase